MHEPSAPPVRISRTVETELAADQLWELVGDGDAWTSWMVDEADVDIEPGADGTVIDDGVRRNVRIDTVDRSERVVFTWWPHDRPEASSTVELVVVPASPGSVLRIIETYGSAMAGGPAVTDWHVRALLLAVRAMLVTASSSVVAGA